MKKGLILIGCGIHAQKNYLQFIKKYGYDLKLIVDTYKAKDRVEKIVGSMFVNPPDLYFVEPPKRNPQKIKEEDYDWLVNYVNSNNIGFVIISTDPLSHKMYLDWAISLGLNILCEKPLTGYEKLNTSVLLAKKLNYDFEYLVDACRNKKAKLFLQTQRRYHPVYEFVYSAVKKIILDYGITINYIGIYSGNGIFNSIDEYVSKESHPHNKGYGKLLHSGYHFIDLFCWFADLNTLNKKVGYTEMSAFTDIYSVKDLNDQFERINKKCKKLSNNSLFKNINNGAINKLDGLGEVDLFTQVVFKSGKSTIINGQLALLQNSTSKRSVSDNNLYNFKNSSAIRKELFIIELGPLYSISVSALQNHNANPIKFWDYNYVVTIHRNSDFIKGKAYEEIYFHNRAADKDFSSLNKKARLKSFQEFLDLRNKSNLETHKLSINLFSLIQENIAKINLHKIGFSKNKIN